MTRAHASILIARPTEAVFTYVATDFFKNYQRWSPQVTSLHATSTGPVRLGTTGRQVRVDLGYRTECSFRVCVFEVGRRVDFKGISAPILSSYRMDGIGDRTRLTFIFEYYGSGLLLLPFNRFMHHAVQDGANQVVSNIKRLVEADATVGYRQKA